MYLVSLANLVGLYPLSSNNSCLSPLATNDKYPNYVYKIFINPNISQL